jgi:hypothetical protein
MEIIKIGRQRVEGIAWIVQNEDIDLDETAKVHAKVLSQEIEKIQTSDGKITVEGAAAIQGIWEDKQFTQRLLNYEVDIPDLSPQ